MKSPHLICWPGLFKRLPKHKAYCCCPHYPLDMEGKPQLLKISYTSETGPKDP